MTRADLLATRVGYWYLVCDTSTGEIRLGTSFEQKGKES